MCAIVRLHAFVDPLCVYVGNTHNKRDDILRDDRRVHRNGIADRKDAQQAKWMDTGSSLLVWGGVLLFAILYALFSPIVGN
jgi:hypothetical protein